MTLFALSRRSILSLALTGAALTFAGATPAQAGNMILQIQQGAVVQNFVGTPNSVGTPSMITVGDYRINMVSGASNNPGDVGSATALMDISTSFISRVSMTSTADLIIRILSTDFTDPTDSTLYLGGGLTANFTGTNSVGSTVTFRSFFNDANTAAFGAGSGTVPVTLTSPGGNVQANGITATKTVTNSGGTFALSSITNINLTAVGGAVTVRSTGVTILQNTPFGPPQVPEPSGLALAFAGLAGFAGFVRRKMKAAV